VLYVSVTTAPKEKPPETTKASKNKRKKMKKKQKRQRLLLEQQILQLRELELHQTDEVWSCFQLSSADSWLILQ